MHLPGDPSIQPGDLVVYHYWMNDRWQSGESVYLVVSVSDGLADVIGPNLVRNVIPTTLLTRPGNHPRDETCSL